jgi:two-component system nitrogen regulation response regulator GlnG
VSLAALAPSVVESELFGHVRGAFTGATADRAGLFELAGGGTLFLDEIGEAPLDVQVKLLRALEAREISRMGAAAPRPIDVRVIAATNRDLPPEIAAGKFRSDLYHRLLVFPIHMPSLADRGDDVRLLAAHFLARHSAGGPPRQMADDFVAALVARPWPGNLRELKHAVEYAAVVSRGGILRAEHLPPPTEGGSATTADERLATAARAWADATLAAVADEGGLHERLLRVVEPAVLERVLAMVGGNRTAAAKVLGLDRGTLRSRLDR